MSTTVIDFGPTPPASPTSSESARATTSPKRVSPALADFKKQGEQVAPASAIVTTQFTVLVDTREQAPYGFTGLQTDAGHPLAVPVQSICLGHGWGDYSVRGMEPALIKKSCPGSDLGEPYPIVSIERKSMDDAHSTFLGWGTHRDNFEIELAQLNGLTFAAVVVECTEHELIENAPEWGQKTKAENARSLSRSIDSWRIRFHRVQWVFCRDRRWAEIKTFRLLEKFWKEKHVR
jgi:hypothetical protein